MNDVEHMSNTAFVVLMIITWSLVGLVIWKQQKDKRDGRRR